MRDQMHTLTVPSMQSFMYIMGRRVFSERKHVYLLYLRASWKM